MRRILLFLMLATLAGCTPEDVAAALRFLHGTPRIYVMFEVEAVTGEPNIPAALDRTAAVVPRRPDLAGIDARAEGFSGETAVIVVQGYTLTRALIALVTQPGGRLPICATAPLRGPRHDAVFRQGASRLGQSIRTANLSDVLDAYRDNAEAT